MEINVKLFLFINGAILAMIVWSIFKRQQRLQPPPTKLRMRDPGNKHSSPSYSQESEPESAAKPRLEPVGRQLSVNFVFEGRNYEAHEVLELPAGCSFEIAEKGYHQIRLKKTGRDKDLIERAFLELQRRIR